MTFPQRTKPLNLYRATLSAALVLSFGASLQAQDLSPQISAPQTAAEPTSTKPTQAVDILSDTQGVDFAPYIAQMMRLVHGSWYKSLVEDADPIPQGGGITLIRLKIHSDGALTGMRLESSSHNVLLDRVAWKAVTQVGTFPPLPKTFNGPDFEVRMRFIVPKNQ